MEIRQDARPDKNAGKVDVTLILAAWSSGSTSVAGFLDKCGAYTCPPHQHTNDARTPVAYEPKAYRDALAACIDEFKLVQKGPSETFTAWFRDWLPAQQRRAAEAGAGPIVLKHPLQTFLLPALDRLAACRYVVVTRPYDRIEATRQRRKWHPVYGKAGAERIYRLSHTYLQNHDKSCLVLPYERFRAEVGLRDQLLAYLGMAPGETQRAAAEAWLR